MNQNQDKNNNNNKVFRECQEVLQEIKLFITKL